jgi:hypothetical protein
MTVFIETGGVGVGKMHTDTHINTKLSSVITVISHNCHNTKKRDYPKAVSFMFVCSRLFNRKLVAEGELDNAVAHILV